MEEGIAHLCYISTATTLLKQKLEKTVTKKKHGNEQREKSLAEFYKMCLNAIV
jgi:protein pelota